MPPAGPLWWTDERINATINLSFVLSQFNQHDQRLLRNSPYFGDGLTDDTYLDWILTRAKRFFLILLDIGLPGKIFGVVDESYDDGDLPIALNAVQELRLSQPPDQLLDKKFYKVQFKYLIKDIKDGDHVRFTDEETIPIEVVGSKDGTHMVKLASNPSKVYARTHFVVDAGRNSPSEADLISEIALMKKYAHPHVLSIHGSYVNKRDFYVLLKPAAEYVLKSFVNEPPKHFESLAKADRCDILINWPHCLASGLAWLHDRGKNHGAIRPSNIFIDNRYHIFLGEFDSKTFFHSEKKIDDIEAYQYAPPERWKRTPTFQTTAKAKLTLHSGGRTAYKIPTSIDSTSGSTSSSSARQSTSDSTTDSAASPVDTARPTATAHSFIPTSKPSRRPNFLNGRLGSSNSLKSSGSSVWRNKPPSSAGGESSQSRASRPGLRDKNSSLTLQISTESSGGTNKAVLPLPVTVAAPEVRRAIVKTWQSAQYDSLPPDVFALGAIILNILSFMCKRSMSAFARHRSSKNRTPGRGGGLADGSFHANLGQVISWAVQLQQDGNKRGAKEDGKAFRAVSPVVEIVKSCLTEEPDDRILAADLAAKLDDSIWPFANVSKLHCRYQPSTFEDAREGVTPTGEAAEAPGSPATIQLPDPDKEVMGEGATDDQSTTLRSNGLKPTTGSSAAPQLSLNSLSSFNFDPEMRLQMPSSIDEEEEALQIENGTSSIFFQDDRSIGPRIASPSVGDRSHNRRSIWDSWQRNDSDVDQDMSAQASLSLRTDGNYETDDEDAASTSTIDQRDKSSFLLPPTRPSSMGFPQTEDPLPQVVKTSTNSTIRDTRGVSSADSPENPKVRSPALSDKSAWDEVMGPFPFPPSNNNTASEPAHIKKTTNRLWIQPSPPSADDVDSSSSDVFNVRRFRANPIQVVAAHEADSLSIEEVNIPRRRGDTRLIRDETDDDAAEPPDVPRHRGAADSVQGSRIRSTIDSVLPTPRERRQILGQDRRVPDKGKSHARH